MTRTAAVRLLPLALAIRRILALGITMAVTAFVSLVLLGVAPPPAPPRPSSSSSATAGSTLERAERAGPRDPRRVGAPRRHHDRQRRRVAGAPVTLELTDVPERQALDIVLRSVAGYMLAPRRAGSPGASTFDRIMILPDERRAVRRRRPPRPAAFRGAAAARRRASARPATTTPDDADDPTRDPVTRTTGQSSPTRAPRNRPRLVPPRSASRRVPGSDRADAERRRGPTPATPQPLGAAAARPRPAINPSGVRRRLAATPASSRRAAADRNSRESAANGRRGGSTDLTIESRRRPRASRLMSEIDRFRPDDRRGVETLYRRTHGADAAEANRLRWDWQHRRNPVQPHRPARHLGRARRPDRRRPLPDAARPRLAEGARGRRRVGHRRDGRARTRSPGARRSARARVGSQQRRGAGARRRRRSRAQCSTGCTGRRRTSCRAS